MIEYHGNRATVTLDPWTGDEYSYRTPYIGNPLKDTLRCKFWFKTTFIANGPWRHMGLQVIQLNKPMELK